MEGDRVKVLRLINRGKQDDFELIERILLEDFVLLEDLCAIGRACFQVGCFEEKIDKIRKGEKTSTTSNDHDLTRLSDFQLKTESFRLAERK